MQLPPQRRLLPTAPHAGPGRVPERWHWQHGPIDLVLVAEGEASAVAAAHEAAWSRFQPLLAELVAELPLLRQPALPPGNPLQGPVARQMWAACAALVQGLPADDSAAVANARCADGRLFLTPMAAVAGAVADALIGCYRRPGIERAWINNGGDIALHLAPGAQARVGLVADLARLDEPGLAALRAGLGRVDGQFSLHADQAVRGVATSGWRGRSQSLGVADSVSVLAASAAAADAAATVLANAVDLPGHPGIARQAADSLRDHSDLGARLVTTAVPGFTATEARQALQPGQQLARSLQAQGLLYAAVLVCQGQVATVAPLAASHGQLAAVA